GGTTEPGVGSLDQTALEVSLQGVTTGAHRVSVTLNGNHVGTVEFAGRERQSASFEFDSSMLREGDNQVQFASAASGDISLTDHVRLTYQHTYTADDDTLRFTANAGEQVRVGGFSTGIVRVVDITDPNNVSEVQGVEPEFDTDGGWSVTL